MAREVSPRCQLSTDRDARIRINRLKTVQFALTVALTFENSCRYPAIPTVAVAVAAVVAAAVAAAVLPIAAAVAAAARNPAHCNLVAGFHTLGLLLPHPSVAAVAASAAAASAAAVPPFHSLPSWNTYLPRAAQRPVRAPGWINES